MKPDYCTYTRHAFLHICHCSRTLSTASWVVSWCRFPPTDQQFERYYNVTDKAMLAWDRVVGNLLEQAMPFLTLFWLNIGLAALGATSYESVAAAGWIYVVFRALYPVSSLGVLAFQAAGGHGALLHEDFNLKGRGSAATEPESGWPLLPALLFLALLASSI